jgi:hypothetical protein
MTVRDFDGTTAGFTTPIALNGLTSTQFPISRITGMFFWNGRLYYTLSGDTRLYYRWFTPESGVLGADTFVASGAGDGRNWSTVSGMTMASGRLVYATTTGNLSAVDFTNGVPAAPPPSSAARPSTASPGSPEGCSSSERQQVRPPPRWVWAGPVPVSCAPSAPVAQGTEQLSPKQQAAGSSPARGTNVHRRRSGGLEALSRGVVTPVPGVAQRSMTRIMPHDAEHLLPGLMCLTPAPSQPKSGSRIRSS